MTAETELRGILAATLSRAQIDDILDRFRAEVRFAASSAVLAGAADGSLPTSFEGPNVDAAAVAALVAGRSIVEAVQS